MDVCKTIWRYRFRSTPTYLGHCYMEGDGGVIDKTQRKLVMNLAAEILYAFACSFRRK